MDKTLQHMLYFLLGIVALGLILYPIINSSISKNYHLLISENGNSDVYTVDISETEITVATNQYNNLATEKKGHVETTQTAPLSTENYQRLAYAFKNLSGAHISVRWSPGYAFYFEDTEGNSALYQISDREAFVELARACASLALGETKMTNGSGQRTYADYGTTQLIKFFESHNLDLSEADQS